MGAIIVALARPQSSDNWQSHNVEGIDIVLALDVSTSMLAEDLKPNRLEAAKKVGAEFVAARKNDNVGIVVFAGASFPLTPLTIDKPSVVNMISGVSCDMIDVDGTAIGVGLSSAVNRLRYSQAKSKVIILLTDGSNNTGAVDPMTAASFAKKYGIRVYTIGVGTNGQAPYPVETPFGIQRRMMDVDIDEGTLRKISSETDGVYFRATDNKSLSNIYSEIDKLERTKIDVEEFSSKTEEYLPWVMIAFLLLLLEYVLRTTILRHNP